MLSPQYCQAWSAHYPSWGLETVWSPSGRQDNPVLITPHGDWKRRAAKLSTLHVLISLPLMGIGNATAGFTESSWSNDSLPLMGIGNMMTATYLGGAAFALITPHGDWKQRHEGRGGDRALRLITPHGDWKLRPHRRAHRCDEVQHDGLITPHGDWKPRPLRFSRRLGPCSLPLMGIGNLGRVVQPGHTAVLITPHGDWKRVAAAWGGDASRRPHYPSWGLETQFSGR